MKLKKMNPTKRCLMERREQNSASFNSALFALLYNVLCCYYLHTPDTTVITKDTVICFTHSYHSEVSYYHYCSL